MKQRVVKFSLNVRTLELMPNQKKEILFAVRNIFEEDTYFNLSVGEIISETGKYSLDELSKTLKITYLAKPMMLKRNEVRVQPILFEATKSPQVGDYYIPFELTTDSGSQFDVKEIYLAISD